MKDGKAEVLDVQIEEGTAMRASAAARGLDTRPGSADLIYLGRRLRECLDSIAHELGLA